MPHPHLIRSGRSALPSLLLLLAMACASDVGRSTAPSAPLEETKVPCEEPARPRLLLDSNEGFLRALSAAPPVALELSQEDFTRTLARMAPQLPRPLRPLLPQRLQLSRTFPLSQAQSAALSSGYQEWCSQRPGGASCLSQVRHEGLYLDEEDRLLMALDAAVQSVWLGVDPVIQQCLDPVAFKTATLVTLSTFLGLLLLPEPISKGIALSMSLVMLAYLGADTAIQVREAWRRLRAEALQAQSFAGLHDAGERFGIVIGAQVTRLLILLATGALGSSSNLFFRGPGLPAMARAALVFKARTGLSLPAVVETAQALRLERVDLIVTLAPPALFMSSKGSRAASGLRPASTESQASRPAPSNYRLPAVEEWRKPRFTPDGKILPYPGTRTPPEPIINFGRNRAGQLVSNGRNTVRFDKNGFPELETKFETLLDDIHIGSGLPQQHIKAANRSLFQAISENPSLARELNLGRTEVARLSNSFDPPTGYAWHHHQDVGRMQLIDSKLHRLSRPHTGGMAIWGGGSPR